MLPTVFLFFRRPNSSYPHKDSENFSLNYIPIIEQVRLYIMFLRPRCCLFGVFFIPLLHKGKVISIMTDNKKEVERAELHRTIWAIADEMRGSVDGWDFKSYILGMLFYRYISENITTYINKGEWETGNSDFNYADLNDAQAEGIREEMVNVKGFFILPSQLFENICKTCDADPNLNMTLEGIFSAIENSAKGTASEDDFKGLFADLDVNSNKLGATVIKRNEKLVKLLRGIQSMKLGDYQDNTIDAFGDAYEYLMGMYASNAGKKRWRILHSAGSK